MWPAVASYLVSKVADEVYDRLRGRLSGEIAAVGDRLEQIEGKLSQLDTKVDQQLMAPLRAGLTFLKLGQPEKAVDQLVHAHAVEPDSPVARFWLGICLIGTGKNKEGKDFLLSAIELNPFVASGFIESRTASDALTLTSSMANAKSTWAVMLESRPVLGKLPKSKGWLKAMFSEKAPTPRVSTSISKASTICGELALGWLLGEDLRSTPETVISLFDLRSGEARWHKLGSNLELALSTPRFVVIKDGPVFKLLSLDGGQEKKVLNPEYFTVMFSGGSETDSKHTWLHQFQKSLLPPQKGYDLATVKSSKPLGFDHGFCEYCDTECVLVPAANPRIRVVLENRWTHAHRMDSAGAWGFIGVCGLKGASTMRLDVDL